MLILGFGACFAVPVLVPWGLVLFCFSLGSLDRNF